MRYTDYNKSTIAPYPSHDINPAYKDMKWHCDYARAAWLDFTFGVPKGVFANNQGDYERNRMYALGKQPNSQYKKWLGVDDQTNNTWMSIDWSIRPIVSTYRDRAISRLMKQSYRIVATPVDMLAKTEQTEYMNQMKVRLLMRQAIQQSGNEELLNHPMLAKQAGEPADIEELEMRIMFGEQFNRSKDAELAVQLGFFENKYNFWRKEVYEDLFDFGVAGYKEWLGEDNKPRFRRVNPENVITSFCRSADFSDTVHAGELINVSLVDLAELKDKEGNALFSEDELQEFASTLAGKFGNPGIMQRTFVGLKGYDKFKCRVLDLEWYSYNDYSYRDTVDENGNVDFRAAEYGRGAKSDKYTRKRYKVIYKCKWIVGTDKCYDWGLATDMKRSNDPKRRWDTELSYKFIAYNFYEMKAQSIMERLIPYLDKYQLTHYKIQNFMNRAVPSGWWIDLDAMENVALSKGGAAMQPKELLTMFFETGVLVGRSLKADGSPMNPNSKPVIPIENTAASELQMFYEDLQMVLQEIQAITGFNDVTTGNANPRTLVPGYELANESTNDALYPMALAEQNLSERLAYDVLRRTQQGLKRGGISGYAPALNENTLQFLSINPEISAREYGIMLEQKSTEQEKMLLLQQMQPDIQNQLLDYSDAVVVMSTHNVKEAQQIFAVKVKKAKERIQQQELQKIQLNNEGAKEAAMIAQQQQLAQKQMEYEFELQKEQMRIKGELQKEQMRIQAQLAIAQQNNMTKLDIADAEQGGKVSSASIQGQAKMQAQQIANMGAVEKQRIANEKQSTSNS